jgi:hypothetical protein
MTLNALRAVAAVSLVLAGCATAADPALAPLPAAAPVASSAAPVGAATISGSDVYARVAFLASDALRGRDTPSQGLNAAAAYLMSEYTMMGAEPAGEDGTYYQWYPFPVLALDSASVHFGTLVGDPAENVMLEYGADFIALGAPDATPGVMGHARLAFVGELPANGLAPDDYSGVVPVVSLAGMPDGAWFQSASRARSAALDAGATALILVLDPAFPDNVLTQLATEAGAARRSIPDTSGIAVFYMTRDAAEGIANRVGTSFAELAASTAAVGAFNTIEAHFAAPLAIVEPGRAPNVAAVIRGSDPVLRDEYVILSAHLDHVGVGEPVDGDSIYNGADDDASGTSALVEIAEAIKSLPEPPRRSIIFLHVSGEEHGLLGSRWYTDNPTVPLDQVVANINIDMIGGNAPDTVVVIGKDYSSLGEVVNAAGAAHPELGLTVSDDIWPEENFFFRSDHFNFARKEIPAIFFFTGVHENYHQPSDELDALDVDKVARVSRLIYHTLLRIANDPERPVWDPAGLEEVRALTR